MTEAEYEETVAKYKEHIAQLENDIRRYPSDAAAVANMQAAVYSIISGELTDITESIEFEKMVFDKIKRRYEARLEKQLERKRELMKKAGGGMEDMTRKALAERPEDPRTNLLRKEFDEYRDRMERVARQNADTINRLKEDLAFERNENARNRTEGILDSTQLQRQVTDLQSRLAAREQELMAAKQRIDELQQNQSFHQQQIMAKLAKLETPSIGTVQTLSTNQSREARMVKIPSWMKLGK